MKSITLNKFAKLLENNKSQFLGSLGWNTELDKTIDIIKTQGHKIVKTYNRTATVSSSKIVKFTYTVDTEINNSRLDLNGVVYIFESEDIGSVYINISKDNNTCLYIIENN